MGHRLRDQITSDAFIRRVFTPDEMNKDSEEAHPEVALSRLVAELARVGNASKVMLSLSGDTDYPVAFAAAEREVPHAQGLKRLESESAGN